MTSKRLEKEESRQAPVRSEEELDAIREKNASGSGVNGGVRRNESVETAEVDERLQDEEEEQAEDAMTGGA
jgi:hypothetical protein